jgi:hypothetical protein
VTGTGVRRGSKHTRVFTGVIFLCCVLLNCEARNALPAPDDEAARRAFVSLIDSGRHEVITLDSFLPRGGRFENAPVRGAFLVEFRATASFGRDVLFVGPSLLDDRIRVAATASETLFRIAGYSARIGEKLQLAGTLGLVYDGRNWTVEPLITDFSAVLQPGERREPDS